MRVHLAISWGRAPAQGRFELECARFVGGGINVGWGEFSREDMRFSFTSTNEPCRICFAADADDVDVNERRAVVRVVDTDKPFSAAFGDILKCDDGTMEIRDSGVSIYAEVDAWASL